MFSEFIKTIKKYRMLSGGEKVVVGVSGGIDSMVLLTLLQQFVEKFKGELVVAHLNHGLRGKESDRDESFVKSVAKEVGLSCEVFDEKELRRRKMGGMLAVGQGSEHRPMIWSTRWRLYRALWQPSSE